MKLSVINGSPRGRKSNTTRIVTTWMFPGADVEMLYTKDVVKDAQPLLQNGADGYLFIFPLYVDSIPAMVKAMFETVEENKASFAGKKVWFIIHSGFPEPKQSRLAEKYVRHFARLAGMECMGVAVMGNSEGLQMAPDRFYGKKPGLFAMLGQDMLAGRAFGAQTLQDIAGKETLSKFLVTLISKFNTSRFMWDKMLKKNGVYEHRMDKPYA